MDSPGQKIFNEEMRVLKHLGPKEKNIFFPNISSLEYVVRKLEFSNLKKKRERENILADKDVTE